MKKSINREWANSVLQQNARRDDSNSESTKIDWVTNGKAFKKSLTFKVLPANSKENNIWVRVVATHWNIGPNKDKRILCTEQTPHLANQKIVCPVCEARRRLLSKGFKEEELCVQGKYGPMSIFEPTVTSNVKVVMLDTDLKQDWSKEHVSILQQKGSYLQTWLVEKYLDADTPDFLVWEKSNPIKFNRPTDNSKWERNPLFSSIEFSEEVVAKLKEENENLTLIDLWKMPSDEELLSVKQDMFTVISEYETAKQTVLNAVTTESVSYEEDIPF